MNSIADILLMIGVIFIGIAIYFLTRWEYALLYIGFVFILSAIFLSFGESEQDDKEQDRE